MIKQESMIYLYNLEMLSLMVMIIIWVVEKLSVRGILIIVYIMMYFFNENIIMIKMIFYMILMILILLRIYLIINMSDLMKNLLMILNKNEN